MKISSSSPACLTHIAAVATALALLTLASCKQERRDGERIPLFTAPGEAELYGHLVVLEEFEDTYMFEAVAFGQDGVGYGVAGNFSPRGDYDPYKSSLLKTIDGGRTWQPTGRRMRGRCLKMHLIDDNLYLLMRQRDSSVSSLMKCSLRDSFTLKPLARLGAQTDTCGLHVINDSTFACGMRFYKRGEDGNVHVSDSVMVTRDSCRTWEALSPLGPSGGYPNFAFDGNRALVTLYDGAGGSFLFVKDIMTGEERELPLPWHFDPVAASDNLIATSSLAFFFRYDDKGVKPVSTFGWIPGWGSFSPEYLHKRGNFVICIGSQRPGGEGKKCVFASVDGGRFWRAALMDDDICGPMATTGGCWHAGMSRNSISVFFTCKGDIRRGYKHCILTLGERMDPAQELYDLIFAPLIEYYKENVPGFNLPDVF